ncbi:hypothetical protein J6590_088346 [Homalodisca vitripennis]|nr:hypothetical protein J6590_088346 [Homalodisca vitripennis]
MSMRYVVDPLVEPSSQTVILPRNPCNSFSLVHIYISLSLVQNIHQVSAASHVIMSMRYLADPLVELSSQTVILPQTPYNSFSMVHIYIRSVQLAT